MKIWPLTLPRIRRGLAYRHDLWRLSRLNSRTIRVALRTPRVRLAPTGLAEVHMLLCHRDFGMSLASLKSLYRYAPTSIGLVIHDNGSLTAHERSLLAAHFVGVRFVRVADTLETVDRHLAALGLERCRALRREFVLAVRLFDFPVIGAGKTILQLDPNVIFLTHPTELLIALERRDPGAPVRFNLDVRPAYSWTEDEIRGATGCRPAPQLNAGLVCVRYDPGMLPDTWRAYEACLSIPRRPGTEWLTEQTLLAVHAGRHGAQALPPEYDVCARLLRTGRSDLISHHCLVHQRPYFIRGLPRSDRSAPNATVLGRWTPVVPAT